MNNNKRNENCSTSESSFPFYCTVLKTPWYKSDLFTHVVLPAFAILLLLYLGTQGFHEYYDEIQARRFVDTSGAGLVKDGAALTETSTPDIKTPPRWWKPMPEVGWWDAFLLACGLPIGESMLAPGPGPGVGVPWKLQMARAMGLLVLPFAFFVLAFRILREEGLRLKIWWWGVSPWRRLNVLCGLGWQGHEIARLILGGARKDKQQRGNRLAILEKNEANPFADTISRLGAALLVRDATVKRSHEDIMIRRAGRIFVVSSDDETNCRIVRQLVGIFSAKCKDTDPPCLKSDGGKPAEDQKEKAPCPCHIGRKRVVCYATVRHPSTRAFLENSTRVGALTVQTFNLEQVTARHLQARRPFCPVLDGNGPEHAHVVIIGWTPMAQALLLNTLHLGHFTEGNTLQITVICPEHAAAREEFYNSYPCLNPERSHILQKFREHIFPAVRFDELPRSDVELLSDTFPLYQSFRPGCLVTAYICLDNGVNSRVLTKRLYPKIKNELKKPEVQNTEVQIFFYYNYPEDFLTKDDPDWIHGNTQDGKIPVETFGGLGRDFDINTITHFFLDNLALQVMRLYDEDAEKGFLKRLENIKNRESKEQYITCRSQRKWDKEEDWKHESNRYAADHIIVKLRCLGFNAQISDPADGSPRRQDNPWHIDILLWILRCLGFNAQISDPVPDGSSRQQNNPWYIDFLLWLLRYLGFNAQISDPADGSPRRQDNPWHIDILLWILRCLGFNAQISDPVPDGSPMQQDNPWYIDIEEAKPDFNVILNQKRTPLAKAEHRRWCAERLLLGWSPFRSPLKKPKITVKEINAWKTDSKSTAQSEKKHIDLVPFDCLPDDEKKKDIGIVMGIPVMLKNARKMHKTADR